MATAPHTTASPVPDPQSRAGAKNVLIFSPDADLARTLVLILEDRFHITRETTISALAESLRSTRPDLVLVDLFTFSEDVRRVLEILRARPSNVPLILLRGYMPLRQDVTAEIEAMGSLVFYKPVDVEMVTQAIEDLLKSGRAA
jgi:DNA-binding NtrC family response regulator